MSSILVQDETRDTLQEWISVDKFLSHVQAGDYYSGVFGMISQAKSYQSSHIGQKGGVPSKRRLQRTVGE